MNKEYIRNIIYQIILDKAKYEISLYPLPPQGIDIANIEAELLKMEILICKEELNNFLVALQEDKKIYNCGFVSRPSYTIRKI